MPTECSPALFEFAPVEGRARGGRLRRRGDHLERRRAAARRDGPRHRPGPALRRLLPRRPRRRSGSSTRSPPWSASASSASRSATRTWSTTTSSGTTRCWPILAGKLAARRTGLRAAGRQEHAEPAGARAGGRARPLPPDRPRRARRSRRCSWTSSSRRTARPRGRSSSTSTPPTSRCTGTKRAASSTATTTPTATCRSTSSAAGTCWRPSCAAPTSTPRPAPWRRSRASSARSAPAGRGFASCCAPTAASPARR